MAVLIGTNILVYPFDYRFPEKQKIAIDILRQGIGEDSVRLPHQAIVEFVAAVTRPIRGYTILKQADALREAEEFLKEFTCTKPFGDVQLISCAGSTRTFGHTRNTTACPRSSLRTFRTIFTARSAW